MKEEKNNVDEVVLEYKEEEEEEEDVAVSVS